MQRSSGLHPERYRDRGGDEGGNDGNGDGGFTPRHSDGDEGDSNHLHGVVGRTQHHVRVLEQEPPPGTDGGVAGSRLGGADCPTPAATWARGR
eukprot:2218161-Rhodomonas_salina.1